MARSSGEQTFINFSGGITTEAPALQFPEVAVKDMNNFVLLKDGTVERRLGLDYEPNNDAIIFPAANLNPSLFALNIYEWNNVNGNPTLSIAVVQVGYRLYFFYLENGTITTSIAADPITAIEFASDDDTGTYLDFSSDDTYLYVANTNRAPLAIQFTEPTIPYTKGSVTKTAIAIRVRDFEYLEKGKDDPVNTVLPDVDLRPDTLTDAHRYNLQNAGWPSVHDCSMEEDSNNGIFTGNDPILYTESTQGVFPALSDVFDQFKGTVASLDRELNAYNPWILYKFQRDQTHSRSNTPASLGKNIIDPFYLVRHVVLNGELSTVDIDLLTPNFTSIAFFAGRVFYAGAKGRDRVSGKIFFSQILTNKNRIPTLSKCYQEADPTDPDDNQIVATDGGVLSISGIATVHKIIPLSHSLLVIASNGVWELLGADNKLFSPDNYLVRKISDIGCTAPNSISVLDGVVYYLGKTSIYRLVENEVSGILQTQDISSSTIRSLFLSINKTNRDNVKSIVDHENKSIVLLYSSDNDTYDGISNKFFYDSAIIFDTRLEAFYRHSFSTDNNGVLTFPVAGISIPQGAVVEIVNDIVVGGDDVVIDPDDVVITNEIQRSNNFSIKFLTVEVASGSYSFSISELTNSSFEDFGVPFESSLETGCMAADNITRNKYVTNLNTFFKRTEDGFIPSGSEFIYSNPSGCTLSYAWDWAACLPRSDNYKGSIQAYKIKPNYIPSGDMDTFDYNRDIISNKTWLRGRGQSLSLKFVSEDNKDMKLLGFTLNWEINTRS